MLLFNGANGGETITSQPMANVSLFTRDIGDVTMDVNDVELIDLHALGGGDPIVVDDLTGTDVRLAEVRVDPAGAW